MIKVFFKKKAVYVCRVFHKYVNIATILNFSKKRSVYEITEIVTEHKTFTRFADVGKFLILKKTSTGRQQARKSGTRE